MVNADPIRKPGGKKKTLIIFGVGGLLAVGYFWYERNKSSTTTGSSADTTTDGIDPSTGIPYADEVSGSLYGLESGVSGDSSNASTSTTSNSTWASAALNWLTSTGGYDTSSAEQAITAYLDGQGLTSAQYQAVTQALAFTGNPPVSVSTPQIATSTGQSNTVSASTITQWTKAIATAQEYYTNLNTELTSKTSGLTAAQRTQKQAALATAEKNLNNVRAEASKATNGAAV